MDNLRGLLGIRRIYRIPNSRIRELCGVRKGLEERIDGVLPWFGHVEKMENDRLLRVSMYESMLVVTQWLGRGRGGLIP